jgi:hypothetical protein
VAHLLKRRAATVVCERLLERLLRAGLWLQASRQVCQVCGCGCLASVRAAHTFTNESTWLAGVTAGVLAMRCGTAAELTGCETEGGPAEDGGAMPPAICITDPTGAQPCNKHAAHHDEGQRPRSGRTARFNVWQYFADQHDALHVQTMTD